MPITIAGSSNPVFLIIRKKAAIKYYLCPRFISARFSRIHSKKPRKPYCFSRFFCLAAFSSASMASMCKKDIFAHFLYRLELFTSTPDRACGSAAKFGARGFRHRVPHRTSFLLNRQGQPQKKNRKSGSFTLLFNIHNLPLTGLAAAPQSSPLRSEHERHFSSIVKGSQKPRYSKAVPRFLAAPDRLELTTLRLTAECSTIRYGLCSNLRQVATYMTDYYFIIVFFNPPTKIQSFITIFPCNFKMPFTRHTLFNSMYFYFFI